LPLKLVVVRTSSWREGVLLGRPRSQPVYARIDALPFKKVGPDKIYAYPYDVLHVMQYVRVHARTVAYV
jgi:hypothetical protein